MTSIEHVIEIDAPIEKVHEFLLDVEFFASSFPGNTVASKNYQGDPSAGDTFSISGLLSGVRMNGSFKFVEVSPERLVISQISGDLAQFKIMSIRSKTESGTKIREVWEFEAPDSLQGAILDSANVKQDMENYLIENHKRLKKMLESSNPS